TNAHGFSGPVGSWASGVLYDNVTIDGGGLALTNRETDDQGVGWAAANGVLWQCTAAVVTCRTPPTAQNWAIGVWGQFVGGGVGPGFADDLDQLTDEMKARGLAILDHHWGLWYDRRRDDHQMVRRIDGDVWPPFYEQPWARSGRGTAWDGLSRYDLTRFNPWYFARLKRFAELGEQKGLVLVHQMYFQHNVLE